MENLGIDSKKVKFVSRSTVYNENNGSIVVAKNPGMNPKSRYISVKHHWFRHHIGNKCVIWNIKSEHQKADI